MNSGTTNLTNCIEILDIGVSPLVDQHAAAKIMGGGNNRNRVFGDIDSDLEALIVNIGKALTNSRCSHAGGNVEKHKRVAVCLHVIMNSAGHDVARSKILPLGCIVSHKRS